MAFKFSLDPAKGNKQLNAKLRAEEGVKARQEKNAMAKALADAEDEAEPDHRDEEMANVPTGNKRHFTGRRSMKSGPGTLEQEANGFPGSGGSGRYLPQSRFGSSHPTASKAREDNKPVENLYSTFVAKASNLPPTMEPDQVKELFAVFKSLQVAKVERFPPPSGPLKGRPSAAMKVTFDKNTEARAFEEAMMKMNDKKYLGTGYYLHLDRYLGGKVTDSTQATEPFGARWQAPAMRKGFAPPPDLGGSSSGRDHPREDREQLIVNATPPSDPATLRLIHQVIEGVLEGGVEFEAALMNDPQAQKEERFAFLFDQKHPLNRYYRWRMHQLVTDSPNSEIISKHGIWNGPEEPLANEFADELTAIEEQPSGDDDEEERLQHRMLPIGDDYPGRVDHGYGMLNPYDRSFLIFLITSVPPGSMVADDWTPITKFAVDHATQGLDEVVDLLVTNIIQPLYMTEANSVAKPQARENLRPDQRKSITVNALRILSDVLLTSYKESGAAYKYRSVIGSQLQDRKVFEYLDQLSGVLELGKLAEAKYREEVNSVLKVWQKETFFEEPMMQRLQDAFNARENAEREMKKLEKAERKVSEINIATAHTSFEDNANIKSRYFDGQDERHDDRSDAQRSERPDERSESSEREAGVTQKSAAEADTLAGQDARPESDDQGRHEVGTSSKAAPIVDEIAGETAAARAKRLRPRAEDMFASDEE